MNRPGLNPCCYAGYVPLGDPKGSIRSMSEFDCYVTDSTIPADANITRRIVDPSTPVIVIAPDVFGVSLHTKIHADRLSERSGFPVVVMDYFDCNASESLPSWVLDLFKDIFAPDSKFSNKSIFQVI